MFTSQNINTLGLFYPIGNTPAVSLTQSLPLKDPAQILLLGCGDLRNVLFTAHADGEFQAAGTGCVWNSIIDQKPDRPLDITSCDVQAAIIGRPYSTTAFIGSN